MQFNKTKSLNEIQDWFLAYSYAKTDIEYWLNTHELATLVHLVYKYQKSEDLGYKILSDISFYKNLKKLLNQDFDEMTKKVHLENDFDFDDFTDQESYFMIKVWNTWVMNLPMAFNLPEEGDDNEN